jgi:BA14K-like protein
VSSLLRSKPRTTCDPISSPVRTATACRRSVYSDAGYASAGYTTDQTYEASDAIELCAQRFRSYDRASQTFLAKNGQRVSCPQYVQ